MLSPYCATRPSTAALRTPDISRYAQPAACIASVTTATVVVCAGTHAPQPSTSASTNCSSSSQSPSSNAPVRSPPETTVVVVVGLVVVVDVDGTSVDGTSTVVGVVG